jgi:hypothetical protein
MVCHPLTHLQTVYGLQGLDDMRQTTVVKIYGGVLKDVTLLHLL